MPEKEHSGGKKFAVFSCEDGEKWGSEHGICKSLIDVFGNRGLCGEQWLSVHAVTGQLPSLDDVKDFDGLLMSGSRHSANDDKAWVHNLAEFVRGVFELQKSNNGKPRLVGLCFAHQLIAKALGGQVDRNPSGNFVITAETLIVKDFLAMQDYFKDSLPQETDCLTLLESHGEAVTQLAPQSKCVASSKSCDNEIVIYNKGDTISMQCHPELEPAAIETHIVTALLRSGTITSEEAKNACEAFKQPLDSQPVINMIKRFLGIQVL